MIVAITNDGFIKKTPKNNFKLQKTGSEGSHLNFYANGVKVLKETTLVDTLVLFTERGICYLIDVVDIPSTDVSNMGLSLYNKFHIVDDSFCCILPIKDFLTNEKIEQYNVLIMTKKGKIIRHKLTDYKKLMNGLQSVSLDDDDYIASVSLAKDNDYIFNCSNMGYGKTFATEDVRISSLKSKGKGVMCYNFGTWSKHYAPHAFLISLDTCNYSEYKSEERKDENFDYISSPSYLLVTSKGYICRTQTTRLVGRGLPGAAIIKLREIDSVVHNMFAVDTDDVLIVTKKGYTIKLNIKSIKIRKFGGKGSLCIKLQDDDEIAACCKISPTKNITIDNKKVETYTLQTQESQEILSNIFKEDDNQSNIMNNNNNNIVKEILSLLFTKEQWNKNELDTICKNKGIMLGSILEEINDYS